MAGQFGNGVTWQFDPAALVGGTPDYGTAIAEVTSIDFSGSTTDLLDSTVHGEAWRTRVPGLSDGGTASITVRFTTNNATHKAIRDARGVLCAHKFTFPKALSSNATPFSWANNAIIQTFSIVAPHDGLLEMTVSLQFSGPPVIVEEAA